MGQPRASRRKVVVVSSDEEDEGPNHSLPSQPSDDEPATKPQKQATGKLQPTKKTAQANLPALANAATQYGGLKKSPKKSSAAATKTKSAVTEKPKAAAKPIYSFFNAATQRLQSSQTPSASPEKRSTPASQDPLEAIHDDSDDGEGAGVQLSKGSSTALAVRKRKAQQGDSFEAESSLPPPASQKFRKASNGDRVPSFSVLNEDKRPWTEQFQPVDVSELAVHKRKVDDVRKWLEMTVNGHRPRVLVLKGAAGTGKTTTIRLLAQSMKLDISEWKNPIGGDFASEGSTSAASQFDEFIARAGRSSGLQFVREDDNADDPKQTMESKRSNDTAASEHDGQLLLIEEFPNTFSRTSNTLQSFRSAISQYLASPVIGNTRPTPIAMIISETLLSTNTALADSFTSHRLLGPELSNHPFLDTIEFNPVALTILTKALETVVLKEARKSGRRRTPGPQVLKRLAESGDIRSAISSLEFLCLRGDGEDTWSSKVTFTKGKKSKTDPPLTASEEEALKLISNRETTLDIFHAVGKVVFNKRIEAPSIAHPPTWLPQHRRSKVPENDIDVLVNEVGTDTSTFLAALHENYALSCSSASTEHTLDSVLGCIDNISDADLLSVDRFSYGTRAFTGSATDSLRQDEMAFQLAVRGLWFNLPSPVSRSAPPDGKKGDAHRMFYPASLRLWRKREEIESVLDSLLAKLQSGDSASSTTPRIKGESAGTGVEGWRRINAATSDPTSDEASDKSGTRNNGAKMEMLVERLPYLAQIMSRKKVSSTLLEQLNTVTRIRDLTSTREEDEDEADAEEKDDPDQEQWSTDLPGTEDSRGIKAKTKPMRTKLHDGSGLGIPVESSVEKLVLEDDDIVDD